MVSKKQTAALTGLSIDETLFKTDLKIEDQQILDILASNPDRKAEKKAKKEEKK